MYYSIDMNFFYSKDNLVALHFKYDQARRRFVEWAQNEIAVVPDFHKRILFSDEAHFWLNGYVNKQNCCIWSEANPQVYVETPLQPEKLTVWCALWAGGIIGPYFFKNDEGHNVTVNGDRYRAMITNFFIPELNNHDVQELWFQQDGAICHTARATIDLLKDTFGDRLISRFRPVNWPPRSCDLTPLDYFLWGYVKSLVYVDKPQTLDHLEDNIRRVIADIRPQMFGKVIENWTSRLDYIRASRGSHMPEIIFKIVTLRADLTIPDCSTTDEHVHLMWSVNNPEVKFNFKSKSSYVYVIEPYSLPENSLVIFYANAYFGNRINATYSQIELRVEPLKLKATIKGTSQRVVGNKSGNLILESEMLNKGLQAVYQWKCSDQYEGTFIHRTFMALVTDVSAKHSVHWCHAHTTCPIDKQKKETWLDGLSFALCPTTGPVHVWRTPALAYDCGCLLQTVKHGGGSDGPVCYNYKENATEPLLIPRKMQIKPKLEIPCVKLKAGKKLSFELQVFNANNSFLSSQSTPTVVIVEGKDIPQVYIEKILTDASNPVYPYLNTKAYHIPAGLSVAIHATITSVRSSLRSVKWDIKGFSSTFTFTTKNGMTVLLLEEGFLVGHGIYLIELSACDTKGACGYANLSIHADPGLSLCKVQLKPYVEYEPIKVEIKGCSIPVGRQPVTYQLYLHSKASVFPFTAPQTSTIFNIVGPPQQMSNGTQISVQACDKFMLCTLFNGPTTAVTLTESREEDREKLMNKATLAIENQNDKANTELNSVVQQPMRAKAYWAYLSLRDLRHCGACADFLIKWSV
ncbi:uncharacterized protein TNCV_4496801 [Trichonephila clavipes]|nr:uncharacterized protein TNCV_4496801 [Trichonephila clavipes]